MAHYEDITPDWPPANAPVVCGEWWGCKDWMVKGGTPQFADGECVRTLDAEPRALTLAQAQGAEAEDAQLSPARWGRHGGGYPVAYVPIGAAPGYAANPLYVTYAAAIAGVEEWRWLSIDELKHRGKPHSGAGALVGLRGGEVVAVVLPVIWTVPADPEAV